MICQDCEKNNVSDNVTAPSKLCRRGRDCLFPSYIYYLTVNRATFGVLIASKVAPFMLRSSVCPRDDSNIRPTV